MENKMQTKKLFLNFLLFSIVLHIAIALSPHAFAAQDFIIENRTSPLFAVNGATGNIVMAPSFEEIT